MSATARGTLVLDRLFRGVGRIKRATGTKDRRMVRRLSDMLTMLYQAGRLDVLEQIRDGHLHLMEVYRHHRGGRWDDIPTAQHVQPHGPTLLDWVATHPCSEKHRAGMKRSFEAIASSARADAA